MFAWDSNWWPYALPYSIAGAVELTMCAMVQNNQHCCGEAPVPADSRGYTYFLFV